MENNRIRYDRQGTPRIAGTSTDNSGRRFISQRRGRSTVQSNLSEYAKNNQTSKSSKEKSSFSRTRFQLFMTGLSSVLFGVTAWFAQATFSAETTARARHALNAALRVDVGSTLTILRILQGLLSTCTAMVLLKAFELVQWALSGKEGGLRGLSLLGLSPTTGFFGTLGIIFTEKPRMPDRAWALLRLILPAAVWLSGILLFVKTSLATVYDPIHTYNVTADVGQFDWSYVTSFLQKLQEVTPEYPYQVVPYTMQAIVYNLVVNSVYSVFSTPINCEGHNCDSYLLTGGLTMTTPWPPTEYPSHPMVKIHDAPACQIEFKRGLSDGDMFSDGDCTLFDAKGPLIGIRFCVTNSQATYGSIAAGIYVCNGTRDGECLTTGTFPNLTTTFSVYSRQASVVVARSNLSIISISSITPPSQTVGINITAFRMALDWLLDYNATGIPATSSIAERFWSGHKQLSNEYWSTELYQTFQSILAFPFWQFNANNFGNTELEAQEIISTLPPEFYTKASIVAPYTKIIINRTMFIAFLALEGIALAFVWAVLLWLWIAHRSLPEISSYPLIDFALKTRSAPSPEVLSPLDTIFLNILHAGDGDIRSAVRDIRVSLSENGVGLQLESISGHL